MSDDDNVCRNSWKEVMKRENSNTTYLLYSWHVDRAIRKNIASKISAPIADKQHVYHMFRTLFEEHDVTKCGVSPKYGSSNLTHCLKCDTFEADWLA